MDEDVSPFNPNELSLDDLAVLRAFESLEELAIESSASMQELQSADQAFASRSTEAKLSSAEEMLLLFVREADEDLTSLRQVLQKLEPDDSLDVVRLLTLQRIAHKMKGTTGAMGCMVMYTIAHYIETLTKHLTQGTIVPFIGLNALIQTVNALEATLSRFVTTGEESDIPLTELETEYKALNIEIQADKLPRSLSPFNEREDRAPVHVLLEPNEDEEAVLPRAVSKTAQEFPPPSPYVRVDVERFEQLVRHTEQLGELAAAIESAQAQVETALQELHVAQARLWRLETLFSTHPISLNSPNGMHKGSNERPTSSLIARILDEAPQRTGHLYQRKSKFSSFSAGAALLWDDMEIDHYTESDVLAHSLSESIADVATASTQLRAAFAQLNRIILKHTEQSANVRNDTLLLRLAPMSSLLPRIERAISMSAIAQHGQVQFEVKGETTEIDQDVLEELKQPLLQLVRTSIANCYLASPQAEETHRIWLHTRVIANEVTIEVGFSMSVGGGAVEEVQEALQRVNGSISVQHNGAGGISFHLRFPRSQGPVQGLLVRAGRQRVIVPFSQVQRIEYERHYETPGRPQEEEANWHRAKAQGTWHYLSPGEGAQGVPLHVLLGMPIEETFLETVRPTLVLQSGDAQLRVQVDEVLGEVKLVVKPLAPHLRRPGIAGTAIDGMGNVLLMLDLPELMRHEDLLQRLAQTASLPGKRDHLQPFEKTPQTILIADDSIYIRQSLRQTLSRAGYRVLEAHDGVEALELLLNQLPDALVLDMEMPNLNGYDLLSILRGHVELARVKTVMLTSRSSEKHQKRAHELGVHAYLTKPCPDETLLATLNSLLA